MNYDKLKDFIKCLNDLGISDLLTVLSNEVLSAMTDVNHGKRFVDKSVFIKDFNDWVAEQYGDGQTGRFNLDIAIPDDTLLDVSFLDIPTNLFADDRNHSYHVWTVQLHNNFPYRSVDQRKLKVNAVAKITHGKNPEDESKTITTCVILTADRKLFQDRFTHVVHHELVHFIINCLVHSGKVQIELYLDDVSSDIDKHNGEEFIADFIPYEVNSDENVLSPLVRFKRDFYVRFNPVYSKIYETILDNIMG